MARNRDGGQGRRRNGKHGIGPFRCLGNVLARSVRPGMDVVQLGAVSAPMLTAPRCALETGSR